MADIRIIRLSHALPAHTFDYVTVSFHNPPTAPPPAAAYSNLAEIDLGGARLLILAGQVALPTGSELRTDPERGPVVAATIDCWSSDAWPLAYRWHKPRAR